MVAVWITLALLAVAAFVVLCLWAIHDGLRHGHVRTNLGSGYTRSGDPIQFWFVISTYAAGAAGVLFFASLVAIDAWQHG